MTPFTARSWPAILTCAASVGVKCPSSLLFQNLGWARPTRGHQRPRASKVDALDLNFVYESKVDGCWGSVNINAAPELARVGHLDGIKVATPRQGAGGGCNLPAV